MSNQRKRQPTHPPHFTPTFKEAEEMFPPQASIAFLEALSSPLRAEILAFLHYRRASASEIAEALEVPATKVRYHLRALARAGMIGSERSHERRGTKEHFWIIRSNFLFTEAEFAARSPEEVAKINEFPVLLVYRDAQAAIEEGSFVRRPDYCTMRFRPQLDEEGWRDLVTVCAETIPRIQDAIERASQRLAESGAEGFPASMALLLFELQPPAQGTPADIPSHEIAG